TGDDLVPQIRKTEPTAVSEVRAAAGSTVPVSSSWEKLIGSCLAKTPESRPRNLSEVLALLGQSSGAARPRVQPAAVAETPVASAATPAATELDTPLKSTGEPASTAHRAAAVPATSSAAEPVVEKSS